MTHMNPHTQPKHTRRIPSADFPLSLPLLLAGTTCQGVFSGEVHALQLTQWQGLISYLSDLQSQDQVLFPHPPSFASYPRKVCSFLSQRLWSFLLLWEPLCPPFGQHLPFFPPPSRVQILSEEKLPPVVPWHEAAPGPPSPQEHSREGSTPHPALNCAAVPRREPPRPLQPRLPFRGR